MTRAILVSLVGFLVSGCVIGTTGRDRIYPPATLTFSLHSNWFQSPASGAEVHIERCFPGSLFNTCTVPMINGTASEEGIFEATLHLNGNYTIWISYEGHEGRRIELSDLEKSQHFDIRLNRVESADNAFPRPYYWESDDA